MPGCCSICNPCVFAQGVVASGVEGKKSKHGNAEDLQEQIVKLKEQLHDAQLQMQQATAAAKLHEEQKVAADARFERASAEVLRIRFVICMGVMEDEMAATVRKQRKSAGRRKQIPTKSSIENRGLQK